MSTSHLPLAPTIKLNNGQIMPLLGLGTWRSYSLDAERAVKKAIDVGYRFIDTAYVYENESEVGSAIKSRIEEGVITRRDIFVLTKLGGIHHDPDLVEMACRKSLSNLNLEYVDLYVIHFPIGQVNIGEKNIHGGLKLSDVDYLDTWKAMEKLVDLNLVRGIGLSNFNAEQTERILKNCRIKPVCNQVECHPAFNQKKLNAFLRERNIVLIAYSPLARPKPDQKWPPFLYDDAAIKIANKYKKNTAQICLRYLIQLGVVPIPKSVSLNRITDNFNVFDFELSSEEMTIFDAYDTGRRMIPFSPMKSHKYFPFNAEY